MLLSPVIVQPKTIAAGRKHAAPRGELMHYERVVSCIGDEPAATSSENSLSLVDRIFCAEPAATSSENALGNASCP